MDNSKALLPRVSKHDSIWSITSSELHNYEVKKLNQEIEFLIQLNKDSGVSNLIQTILKFISDNPQQKSLPPMPNF